MTDSNNHTYLCHTESILKRDSNNQIYLNKVEAENRISAVKNGKKSANE